MGFTNKVLDVRMAEGADSQTRVFTLLTPLYYTAQDGTQYRVIEGSTTDGLSVPQALTNVIPAHGAWAWSGYIHDAAYHHTLEVLNSAGKWVVANLDKGGMDALLNEALESQGCPAALRIAIYEAVVMAGGPAIEGDLSLPIPGSHAIKVS